MKIPLTSGGVVDTNKLSDRDAALHEAVSNLYLTCEKFNVTGFCKVVLENGEGIGMLHLPNESDEVRGKHYTNLVTTINDWLMKTSDDRLMIVDTQADDSDEGKGLE